MPWMESTHMSRRSEFVASPGPSWQRWLKAARERRATLAIEGGLDSPHPRPLSDFGEQLS
jgi:uncharacterized protein YjiS (DUF1127 family)